MNKLDALKVLGHAYWYLAGEDENYEVYQENKEPAEILEGRFGYIRRSLSIKDLTPKHNTEGTNPNGPRYF